MTACCHRSDCPRDEPGPGGVLYICTQQVLRIADEISVRDAELLARLAQ